MTDRLGRRCPPAEETCGQFYTHEVSGTVLFKAAVASQSQDEASSTCTCHGFVRPHLPGCPGSDAKVLMSRSRCPGSRYLGSQWSGPDAQAMMPRFPMPRSLMLSPQCPDPDVQAPDAEVPDTQAPNAQTPMPRP